jgi:hypothetical protein
MPLLFGHKTIAGFRSLLLVLLWVSVSGCRNDVVRRVRYSLPPAALVPVGSGEIRDLSNRFGASFCKVYPEAAPSENFGCDHYFFRDSSPGQIPGQPLLADSFEGYRVVLITGFGGGCLTDPALRPFADAAPHLKSHGIDLEWVPITGIQSIEADARVILEYLESTNDPKKRKILLVGYSKGAPDAQGAIVKWLKQSSKSFEIAALISVSGMIGGSRVYDLVADPQKLISMFDHIPILGCPPGSRDFDSISRQERYRFLADNLADLKRVPTYAMTAASRPENTSRILRPFWNRLSVYGVDQDSQMAVVEQIPPGATFLGTARADHWAPAIPFEHQPKVARWIDKNHYPRTALLETLIRFVVADLATAK